MATLVYVPWRRYICTVPALLVSFYRLISLRALSPTSLYRSTFLKLCHVINGGPDPHTQIDSFEGERSRSSTCTVMSGGRLLKANQQGQNQYGIRVY